MLTNPKDVEFGIYQVSDSLDLKLRTVEIKIERVGDHAFSYIRKDSENNIVEKIIPSKDNKLLIEITPIRPLNYPARRTNYLYLNFDKEIFLSEGSAASVFVQCPIEIGIFLVHDSHKDSLDWFTCDPSSSRFGLFGPPDSGRLCKYFPVQVVESHEESDPFLNCVLQVILENQLDIGHPVSKIVFPVTDHNLYYKGAKSAIDSLKLTLRKRGLVKFGDVQTSSFSESGWTKSPSWEATTTTQSMEMGLD